MLRTRMLGRLSQAQMDVALAHYAYGLTQSLCANGSASQHVECIVSLLGEALPDDRANQAIHSREAFNERLAQMCDGLVRIGERDALAMAGSGASPVLQAVNKK